MLCRDGYRLNGFCGIMARCKDSQDFRVTKIEEPGQENETDA